MEADFGHWSFRFTSRIRDHLTCPVCRRTEVSGLVLRHWFSFRYPIHHGQHIIPKSPLSNGSACPFAWKGRATHWEFCPEQVRDPRAQQPAWKQRRASGGPFCTSHEIISSDEADRHVRQGCTRKSSFVGHMVTPNNSQMLLLRIAHRGWKYRRWI